MKQQSYGRPALGTREETAACRFVKKVDQILKVVETVVKRGPSPEVDPADYLCADPEKRIALKLADVRYEIIQRSFPLKDFFKRFVNGKIRVCSQIRSPLFRS